MIGKNYLRPLLFDEILTISLYGTEEDLEKLEECLASDEKDSSTCQREVVLLAEKVRDSLKVGLRTTCCPACHAFETCTHKWLRAERGIRSTCCFRCRHYVKCAEIIKESHLRNVVRNSKVTNEDESSYSSYDLPVY